MTTRILISLDAHLPVSFQSVGHESYLTLPCSPGVHRCPAPDIRWHHDPSPLCPGAGDDRGASLFHPGLAVSEPGDHLAGHCYGVVQMVGYFFYTEKTSIRFPFKLNGI